MVASIFRPDSSKLFERIYPRFPLSRKMWKVSFFTIDLNSLMVVLLPALGFPTTIAPFSFYPFRIFDDLNPHGGFG
jgi:hypothetical protein